MHKLYIYITAIFFFGGKIYAQEINVDSLIAVFSHNPKTADFILNYVRENHNSHPSIVKELSRRAIPIVEYRKDTFAIALLYNELGNCLRIEGKLDSATIAYRYAANLALQGKYKEYAIAPVSNIGQVFAEQGKFHEALIFYKNVEDKIATEKDTQSRMNYESNLYANYANIHMLKGAFDSALIYYSKAAIIANKLQNEEILVSTYNAIGALFSDKLNSCDSAIKYFIKSLHLYKKQHYNLGIGLTYYNLADCYRKQGNYLLAETENNRAFQFLATEDSLFLAYPIFLRGILTENKGDLPTAIRLYQTSITLNENRGAIGNIWEVYYYLGSVYKKLQKHSSSIESYNNAYRFAAEIDNTEYITKALKGIADIYVQIGNTERALFYYQKYVAKNELYQIQEQSKNAQRAHVFYEIPLKELQISEQKARIEIETEKRRRKNLQNIVLWIGLSMLALFTFSLYKTYKRIKRHKKHLERLYKIINEQKETILHTNKGYISSLRELISQQFQDSYIPPEIISENLSRIDNLQELLDMAYIQGDQVTMDYTAFITEFCKKIEQSFTIPIRLTVNKNLILPTATCVAITLIIDELIRNASKYAFPNKSEAILIVTLMRQEDFIDIIVKDNGIGLQSDFSMQQQTRGLRMVNNLVLKTRGTITVSNDNGACFFIKIHIPDR